MTKNLIILLFISGLLFLSSCKTYLIPIESFKEQFSRVDTTDQAYITLDIMFRNPHYTNTLQTIKCIDKKGNPTILANTPSVEIKFIHPGFKRNRTVCSFNRISLEDCCVVGVKSRDFPISLVTIPLESITKIAIMDGQRSFHWNGK